MTHLFQIIFSKKNQKKWFSLLTVCLLFSECLPLPSAFFSFSAVTVFAEDAAENESSIVTTAEVSANTENTAAVEISATSCVLMEASTGQIIFEKNMEASLPPASITKIMTLVLIFEALEEGKFTLADEVSVSEHAASMGGSQVFLEPYETQTVETMIKCITICSANDACVAMAEFVAGSEEAFVQKMNEKAREIGMKHTTFVNCCGLDTTGHMSSAYDVALMSRELITKYPAIKNYSTIWMDTIIHKTKRGESEFGLSNTNKLLKQYNGITGLKTGSTSQAKYCLSATAERNGLELIAVIMAAPDTKTRFAEAAKLLNYGYTICTLYQDMHNEFAVPPIEVKGGTEAQVEVIPKQPFSYLCLKGEAPAAITKEIRLVEYLEAPVNTGDEAGRLIYHLNGKEIGYVPILAAHDVKRAVYPDYLQKIIFIFFKKST